MLAKGRLLQRALLALVTLAAAGGQARAANPQTPKEAELWTKLRGRIETVGESLDGVGGVCVKDLKTGAMIEIRGGEVFPRASSIKLVVLLG